MGLFQAPKSSPDSNGRRGLSVLLLAFLLWCGWHRNCLFPTPRRAFEKARIDWQPCREDPEFLCAFLEVPTDYTDSTAGKSVLALTNFPTKVSKDERRGIIITNYGGPGVPGRDASFGQARRIQNVTGNRHDIISFDQRGLGHSLPAVNCFGSALAYEQFQTNTVFETTFSVPNDPFSDAGRAVLIEQQKQALALEETQGAICGQTVGAKALGYMSTTTTILDMEEISRIIEGEDALINFYGGSYGSIVGQYLANMLPHKAGRIYISGTVPADMWSNIHYETQQTLRLLLTDSEKVLQFFLNECFEAGLDYCQLARKEDTSWRTIQTRIDAFIQRLQEQPMKVTNYSRPGYLTSGGVRMTLFLTLQMPAMWQLLSSSLARAMYDADGSQLLRFINHRYPSPNPPSDPDGYVDIGQGNLGRLAISCGDALPRTPKENLPTAEDIINDILATLRDTSPRFGATVHLMEQHGGCQFWPGTGVGPTRFRGPFNQTLATPMLVVSNIYDAITPVAAGRIIRSQMRGKRPPSYPRHCWALVSCSRHRLCCESHQNIFC
ncbi:AB hydrolase-1 domain-containing protein [Mycena indigotica]|uniref:AB hydrolase-1 domain-containing protein n=1 Tax=Mycena indigotica TaxID=2126181 RepID=A0A8H6SPL1_9AGAR|nr:AB hydrolase-1 domain-containing protein [Mycena indigotica]KAF7303665.1 AB hydrolase-1 domain-containing protein [Mycena indigotica]